MRSKIFFNLSIIFLFVFLSLAIFWPVLFGGKTINDHYGLDLAHYKFLSDLNNVLKQGHLQLWWNNYLGGFPVYLTQVGFFNPLIFIFYNFFNNFQLYNWLTVFNFILAGVAMYWFARNLSLSKISSAIAGIVYILSQNSLYWGATLPFSNVYAFIPLFFLALLKISRNEKNWFVWGTLISAYGLAAGETQVVFFTLVIAFFWSIFLVYSKNQETAISKTEKFKPIWGYAIFIIGGAILASFWLLPTLNYMQLTTRGEALKYEDLVFDFMRIADPLRFLYPYIQIPQFTGLVSLGIIPNYYIGAVTFFLAIAAIFLFKKNKLAAFWTGIAAFSFLVRIKWTGIFWALHFLPGFDRFRGSFLWAFIGTFSLALLAGFGLDNIEQIKESKYFRKFISALKIFGWINIILIAGIFLTSLFRDKILKAIFQFFDTKIYIGKLLPLEHYHDVIISEFNKFIGAFSFIDYHFVISFSSVLIAISIFVLYQKNKISFDNFKKAILIFVIFNLVLIWQGYYNFISQSKIIEYPNTVDFIKNHNSNNELFRYFRFYPPEMYQQFAIFNVEDWDDYKFKTLESNIGLYFNMDSFGGMEPALSGRIANVLDEIGYEHPTTIAGKPWLWATALSLPQKISRFSSSQNQNLLSMLNIKYLFSSFKLPNFKLAYETTATEKNIPVYVYENPEVMPRIYFAKDVKYADSNDAFSALLKIKDFKKLTLIECEKDCPQFPISNFQFSNVKVEEMKPEYVKIKTSGDGGWLIYSDANLPTWEAYLDNQQVPIYTANYLFKSVFVPEGEHEVIFEYPGIAKQDKKALENLIDFK